MAPLRSLLRRSATGGAWSCRLLPLQACGSGWPLAARSVDAVLACAPRAAHESIRLFHSRGHGHGHGHDHGHANGHAHGHQHDAQGIEADGTPRLRPPGEQGSEDQLCNDLAAAHRLMVAYGLDELSGSRVSARIPAGRDYFTTPADRHWAMVTPWNLRRTDFGATGDMHDVIFKALPDQAHAVVECRSPAIEAVSTLTSGLQQLSGSSAPFAGRLAITEQAASAVPDELARELGAVVSPPALVLLVRGQGAFTFAPSIGQALMAMIHLNRACAVQLKVLSAGGKARDAPVPSAGSEDPLPRFQAEWDKLRLWLGACEHQDLPPVLRSNLS